MTAREKLLRKVRALLEKTTARGCTEAEALAAAQRAAEIMAEHGIDAAELQFEARRSKADNAGGGQKARLWPVIAWCTHCAPTIVDVDGGDGVEFVGREPGPQIAVYLREVCERAIDHELARFKASPLYRRKRKLAVKRQVSAAFVGAMVDRLRLRLREIFGPQHSDEAVAQALAERDRRRPDWVAVPQPQKELRHLGARLAGFGAGGRVHLAHGVEGSEAPRVIGGR